jgi:hypothetical protein
MVVSNMKTTTMLTLQNRPARLQLSLSGTSHGQSSQLSAVEDTFRDKIEVRFDVGSQRTGDANSVRVKEQESTSRPGFTSVQGVVYDRSRAYGVGLWVTPPGADGARTYQGQIKDDQIQLRQTSMPGGYYRVDGRVGHESVDLSIRTFGSRVNVEGQTGRHSVRLDGYENGGASDIPLSGLIASIAASAYIQRY